jgi:hypothetical protein
MIKGILTQGKHKFIFMDKIQEIYVSGQKVFATNGAYPSNVAVTVLGAYDSNERAQEVFDIMMIDLINDDQYIYHMPNE